MIPGLKRTSAAQQCPTTKKKKKRGRGWRRGRRRNKSNTLSQMLSLEAREVILSLFISLDKTVPSWRLKKGSPTLCFCFCYSSMPQLYQWHWHWKWCWVHWEAHLGHFTSTWPSFKNISHVSCGCEFQIITGHSGFAFARGWRAMLYASMTSFKQVFFFFLFFNFPRWDLSRRSILPGRVLNICYQVL